MTQGVLFRSAEQAIAENRSRGRAGKGGAGKTGLRDQGGDVAALQSQQAAEHKAQLL